MSQTTGEYKIAETGQGGVLSQLSEYLSRPARQNLVRAIYETLQFEVDERKNIQRRLGQPVDRTYTARSQLTTLLGVHERTTARWVNGGFQACNYNADKIIRAALAKCPERAVVILVEDFEHHRFLLDEMVVETRQGVVMSPPEVVA